MIYDDERKIGYEKGWEEGWEAGFDSGREELLKKQPHWIPVEERLPKSMINKVIVYVQHEDLASRIGFGHLEKYHGVGTWWDLERDEPFIKHGFTVTHWMPMPKSPDGERLILD